MCQIIWGDISVIEMRFSPLSRPELSRDGGSCGVYTRRYSGADKERYLAQNKQNKILPLTVNDIYINQLLLTTFQQVETSTLCLSAPQILIVWIKYLFLKVNDYIMMIGHKQIRLGLISRKIMHNYPRAYQRNCDKGEVRPHRCH